MNVTNNIANTTYQVAGNVITLICNTGYIIDGNNRPQATYIDAEGNPARRYFVAAEDNLTAKATLSNIDSDADVTLSGTVIQGGGGISYIVDNQLVNVQETLPDSYPAGEISITLTAVDGTEFNPENPPQVFYYNSMGDPTVEKFIVSGDKKTASLTFTPDADNGETLEFTGGAEPIVVIGENYGSINVYLVTLDELAEFSKKRFFKETGNDPETGAAIYENIDLGAYVNRIRRIYTNIGASSTDVIRCGNYNTGVSCHQPAQDKITLDFGTAVVPAHNEDNTDYESEIQIFLPFAGFVNLNNDYAGKTIALQYVINVVTGNGVALLSCNGVIFQVEETEPSSEILYLSPSTQVKTVGGDDWNEMLYYGLEPYIYCKWYESASEGRNTDRQTGILGDFRGFNVFDDVTPIHTAEMIAEEQEMIYTALSDGVYIE